MPIEEDIHDVDEGIARTLDAFANLLVTSERAPVPRHLRSMVAPLKRSRFSPRTACRRKAGSCRQRDPTS